MTFANITELTTYINRYLISNGTNSITGDQLNIALDGIIQFLSEAGTLTNIHLGQGMDGAGTDITTTGTVALPNVVTAGTYGDSTHVPQVTLDTVGRVIAVTPVSIAASSGTVQSVTGLNTNNADPVNPVVRVSVDGSTITGLGTPASPLVANITTFDTHNYTDSVTGVTSVVIVSGLSYTPSFACITPKTGTTGAILIARNFWLTYGAGTVTLNFAVSTTTTLDIDCITFQ